MGGELSRPHHRRRHHLRRPLRHEASSTAASTVRMARTLTFLSWEAQTQVLTQPRRS